MRSRKTEQTAPFTDTPVLEGFYHCNETLQPESTLGRKVVWLTLPVYGPSLEEARQKLKHGWKLEVGADAETTEEC